MCYRWAFAGEIRFGLSEIKNASWGWGIWTTPVGSYIHFHIRWNEKEKLDWECFQTRDAAYARALSLVLNDETFAIEEVSTACPLRSKSASS